MRCAPEQSSLPKQTPLPRRRGKYCERPIHRFGSHSSPREPYQRMLSGLPRSEGDCEMTRHRHTAMERQHFDFLHQLQCVVTARRYPIEAAHIRYADALFEKPITGMGAKPDPWWCLPLLASEHVAQHGMSEREYWRARGFDPDSRELSPLALCLKLWGFSQIGDVDSARTAIIQHRWNARIEGVA